MFKCDRITINGSYTHYNGNLFTECATLSRRYKEMLPQYPASICRRRMIFLSDYKKKAPNINENSHFDSGKETGQSPYKIINLDLSSCDTSDTSWVYGQTATGKDKVIAYNDNITYDQLVTNGIIMEEPNIETSIENEREYKVSYPSF